MAKNIELSETTQLLKESDDKLDILYDSVLRIKNMSHRLKDEVDTHKPLINNLGGDVDGAASNLETRIKGVEQIIEEENKCCGMLPYYITIGSQIIIILLIIATWTIW